MERLCYLQHQLSQPLLSPGPQKIHSLQRCTSPLLSFLQHCPSSFQRPRSRPCPRMGYPSLSQSVRGFAMPTVSLTRQSFRLSDNETLFRKIQRGFEAFEISLLVYLLRLITMYIWHVIGVLRFLGVAPTVVTTPMKSTPRHCGVFTLERPPCTLIACRVSTSHWRRSACDLPFTAEQAGDRMLVPSLGRWQLQHALSGLWVRRQRRRRWCLRRATGARLVDQMYARCRRPDIGCRKRR